MRKVGRRIAMETREPRSTDFLLQQLSVGVSIHWTGLLDWNTGLLLNHKRQFSSVN